MDIIEISKRSLKRFLPHVLLIIMAVSVFVALWLWASFKETQDALAANPVTSTFSMNPTAVGTGGQSSTASITVQNAGICWLVGTDPESTVTLPAGYSRTNCATQTLPPAASGSDVYDQGYIFCPTISAGPQVGPIVLSSTGLTTWTVPADWTNTNTIHVIGGGGGGASGGGGGGGGGGGAYSRMTNVALTPGNTVGIRIGTGGTQNTAGGDTYLCDSTSNCSAITGSAVKVGAKGGNGGGSGSAAGGQSASGIGATKFSGGTGGSATSNGSAGGGGAGGPNGNGANGGSSGRAEAAGGGAASGGGNGRSANADGGCWLGCGGTGGNRQGTSFSSCKGSGTHGTTGSGCMGDGSRGGNGANGGGGGGGDDDGSNWRGGNGGAGINITGTAGSGGGGGGGRTSGGAGGVYGGGGGGGAKYNSGYTGGTGGQGVIIIYYTSSDTSAASRSSNHVVNTETKYTLSCNDLDGVPVAPKEVVVGVSSQTSCVLDGATVLYGGSRTFYSQEYAPHGELCSSYSQSRTCTDYGVLTGSDTYDESSCSVADLPYLTVSNRYVRQGAPVTFEWDVHVNDPAGCTFTGPGAPGTIGSTEGSVEITIDGTSTYKLTCPLGETSVTVNLISQVRES